MIRSLRAPPENYQKALTGHIRQLQQNGHKVVLITFNRPYEQIKQTLRDQGVEGVFYLDSTGAVSSHTAFLPDAMFVDSPSHLEGVTLRASLICKRLGPQAYVVLDSMNVVAQHNSLPLAQEFTRFLTTAMRGHRVPADLVVVDGADGARLCEALSATMDSQEPLAAA